MLARIVILLFGSGASTVGGVAPAATPKRNVILVMRAR